MWWIRRGAAITAIISGLLGLRLAALAGLAGVPLPWFGLVLLGVFGIAILVLVALWIIEPLTRR